MTILAFLIKFFILIVFCALSEYCVSLYLGIDFWEDENKEEWTIYRVGRAIGLITAAFALILF